ncbi:hypothetical protein VPNG_01107 [Cytospora leucostoma]|uniref:RRN6 beta-propeller domain-containing protein n=1 Tax=Cytospora leucostoma TaxID=1230097 RepID=A0A423XKT3_9PEZI|nr:hypothetical protein VPNG_01107 [Cytospora leucostoma]
MAEPQGQGRRGPNDKNAHNIPIHRVNDFSLGHLGQISYKHVGDEDVDVGNLGSSRKLEELPSLHQVLHFEKWFPPTRAGFAAPSSRTFQYTKSQKYWLVKTHPEAYQGIPDVPKLLSKQVRDARAYDHGEENQTASTLAIGAITDMRNPSRPGAWPVVAVAAGEAAHILRISSMSLEDWVCEGHSLPVGCNPTYGSVAAGGTQPIFQGLWCSDGTAISQLRFATKQRQVDPLRWLIVQKPSSTTIFEPQLSAKPVKNSASMLSLDLGGEEHIAVNPIVTLSTSMTGGDTHCDFSVNLGEDEDAPQIAIVDRSGNWSVWYIEREGHRRMKTTKAVPKSKGIWDLPTSLGLPNGAGLSEERFRVTWAFTARKSDDWERDSNTSDDPRTPNTLHTAYLSGLDTTPSRYERLVISNHTHLQVLDANAGTSLSWLSFSRPDGTDALLDAQVFPGSPSHVLVLTTKKLYLLHISDVEHQEASRLTVLLSCPHFMSHGSEVPRLSVTRLRTSPDRASVLVLLHSNRNSRVSIFYLTTHFQDGNVDFHHQVMQITGLEASSPGDPQGIECLTAVPLQLSALRKRRGPKSETTENHIESSEVQYYQVFRLATDLSLTSSIFAVTSGAVERLARPIKSALPGWSEARRATYLRRKLLREGEKAFVVPDTTEEDKQLSVARPPETLVHHDTFQLRYYFVRLVEEINNGVFGEPGSVSTGSGTFGPFGPVQAALADREADDYVSLKPLLGFSGFWQPLDLTEVETGWDGQMRRLQESSSIRLFECGHYGPRLSVVDVFEMLSVNWSAELPAESLKAMQWRHIQMALERMAAEVYLSERGVYMAPASTIELASRTLPREGDSQASLKSEFEDLPLSQPRSDVSLPTPSATPSSSRATSEVLQESQQSQEYDDAEHEDPAVTRLRMYLPSIKFTPPARSGQSRVLSLWPEQRGSDPAEYRYSRTGKPDAESEAARRRRQREEERMRKRAERRAHINFKMERSGEAFSQPLMPSSSHAA